ncbi:MAG TPA: M48 family metallopeptidase [Clostridia bacterium]
MNTKNSEMIREDNYTTATIVKALFFVLFTYLLLIISVGLTILTGAGIVVLIYYICANYIGRIPVGILITIVIGMGIGILSMFKAVIYSLKPKVSYQPALILEKEKQNELIDFINELCNKMNTKIPDHILLHAEPEFFVQQGKVSTFSGVVKGRILAIGMPLLNYLNKNELRAILSHEFAHFTGQDTLYSAYILPVYESTITAINNMQAYTSNKENSGFLMLPMILPLFILKTYYKIFNLSNMKRSREREKRADIIACQYCGSEDFKNALTKAVSFSGIFSNNATPQILGLLEKGKVYVNYYGYLRDCEKSVNELSDTYKNRALDEKTDRHSSHPSLNDRLKYVPDVVRKYSTDDSSINLINGYEEYEKSLTSTYTQYLAYIHGVRTNA